MQGVTVEIIGKLGVIEALGLLDRLRQHLAGGVAERHKTETERIDLFGRRLFLIALEHIGDAGEIERRRRHETLHDDDAVEQRAELHFNRRDQEPDHGAAEHLRL